MRMIFVEVLMGNKIKIAEERKMERICSWKKESKECLKEKQQIV